MERIYSPITSPGGGADGGGTSTPCHDLRCSCGSLLARLVAEGVELKCRRCKSIVILPLEGDRRSLRRVTR